MSERTCLDELRIADDWTVGDLQTVADCEEALVQLARDVANIDNQIADEEAESSVTGVAINIEWLSRAKGARSVKNTIRGIVQRKQSDMVRAARRLDRETWRGRFIDRFKDKYPAQYAEILEEAQAVGEAG